METVYDWVTVLIFAGLITLFLSRSTGEEIAGDSIWHYLVPSVGCALANWLGNEGWDLPAIALIAAAIGYIYHFLLRQGPPANSR